jgi:excinuclease ABC subunit A
MQTNHQLAATEPATFSSDATGYAHIEIYGAREHNLKNIDVRIPRNKLVVITGISGSGKSSLAFDTVYAEGQRRYMESFSAYARSFLGNMERPNVDKINGLSPVISIAQKTTSRNPRSTVGTVTEIYDFMRLLYARTAEAFSYVTGEKMTRQSQDQIINHILQNFPGQKLILLAPVVKGRKGHYRELFVQISKMGFTKVRIDGDIQDIKAKMQLDRYKTHDIEIVIDRLVVRDDERFRISQSVQTSLQHGKGIMMIQDEKGKTTQFSKFLMCPTSGIAYDEPAPNTFSFNSPYGACPVCNGLGVIEEITEDAIIPDRELSVSRGAILPLGEYREIWIFNEIGTLLKKFKLNISTPVKDYPPDALQALLYGTDSLILQKNPEAKITSNQYVYRFEGIINFLKKQQETGSEKMQDWLQDYMVTSVCPECKGARLKKESLHFKIDNRNIAELAQMGITELSHWFSDLETV